MITRFGLAPRREGMTVEAFQQHWVERHAPIIARLPGLLRYWQNHALPSPLPWPGFDACSEMDAPDIAAFDRVFADERYLLEGRDDEERFVDRSLGGHVLSERIVDQGQQREGDVRLLTFLRLAPGSEVADVREPLMDPMRGQGSRGREVFVRVTSSSVFDAVEALWFAGHSDATDYLRSTAQRDRRLLAGRVSATERLLAQAVIVR